MLDTKQKLLLFLFGLFIFVFSCGMLFAFENNIIFDEKFLIVIFLILCLLVAFILIKYIFIPIISCCLPYNFNELKLQIGEPELSFKVRLVALNWLQFHNFSAQINFYRNFLLIVAFNKAVVVKNVSDIHFSQSVWSRYRVEFFKESSKITVLLSKKQYQYLINFVNVNMNGD